MSSPKKRIEKDADPGKKYIKSQEYTDRGTSFEDDPYRQQPEFEKEEDELFDDAV